MIRILVLVASITFCYAQDDSLFGRSERAWAGKDYPTYINYATRLAGFSRNPATLIRLAQAHAHTSDSLAWTYLEELADKGLIYDLDTMKAFSSLNDAQRKSKLVERFKANARISDKSDTAFMIHEPSLVPEGIAVDSKGTFYVSSYAQAKIVQVKLKGKKVSDFAPTGDHGLLGTLGMKVDTKTGELLVCAADDFNLRKGTAGLFIYNAKDGAFKRIITAPAGDRLVNDVAFDSQRNIYVTDSKPGVVLKANGNVFEKILDGFIYANGIAIDDKDEYLFVADYTGLTSINLKTNKRTKVGDPKKHCLEGIDGLYFHNGSLIAVQNGLGDGNERIVRIKLTNGDQVEKVEVLQTWRKDFAVPTTGVVYQNAFYYIANSYVTSFKRDGTIAPQKVAMDPIILRLPLN